MTGTSYDLVHESEITASRSVRDDGAVYALGGDRVGCELRPSRLPPSVMSSTRQHIVATVKALPKTSIDYVQSLPRRYRQLKTFTKLMIW